MLEKNEKKMYFDAHFHYFDCVKVQCADFFYAWNGCSCAQSVEEWNFQKSAAGNIKKSFGIHPQNVNHNLNKNTMLEFMENLLRSKEICCAGELGFDFFSDNLKEYSDLQEEIFLNQIDLCIKYTVPAVIHCRKANYKLFEYSDRLKKLPAVLFHSFMGTSNEAFSLLKRDINGYFSFGKQIMNGNKKVVACVKELPLNTLLLETDAPYQFLKGESITYISDIKRIYDAAIELRNPCEVERFYYQMRENFYNLYENNRNKE